jgi:hypothetical protein
MKDGAATRQIMLSTSMSEQLFETSDCKACIFNNSAHRDRVHRIVSWNDDEIGCGSCVAQHLTNGTVSFTSSPSRTHRGDGSTNT